MSALDHFLYEHDLEADVGAPLRECGIDNMSDLEALTQVSAAAHRLPRRRPFTTRHFARRRISSSLVSLQMRVHGCGLRSAGRRVPTSALPCSTVRQ